MEVLALSVEVVAVVLTLSGMAYGVLALWGARDFERSEKARPITGFAPGVSVLKPLKGVDARMYAAFSSQCKQTYGGAWELIFGVASLEDDAVAAVARLRVEHPLIEIRLIECGKRLGTNGKVSTLAQLVTEARFEHLVVNDSDIRVSPRYLERVMAPFVDAGVGLVTVPYVGRAVGGVWSRLEALGISTDFFVGVLTARRLEGGIRFGLGSTLATTKTALAAIGGFEALVNELADDYELGVRLARAGYRVELINEVVETSVPAYSLRGFCEHQLRWARGDAGFAALGVCGVGGDIYAALGVGCGGG